MNCQPGDLALIVRNTYNTPCIARQLGHVIQVEMALPTVEGPIVWSVFGPTLCAHCGGWRTYPDADLKPLPKPEAEGEGGPVEAPLDAPVVLPVLEPEVRPVASEWFRCRWLGEAPAPRPVTPVRRAPRVAAEPQPVLFA